MGHLLYKIGRHWDNNAPYQVHRITGSEKRRFRGFLPRMGMVASLSCELGHLYSFFITRIYSMPSLFFIASLLRVTDANLLFETALSDPFSFL